MPGGLPVDPQITKGVPKWTLQVFVQIPRTRKESQNGPSRSSKSQCCDMKIKIILPAESQSIVVCSRRLLLNSCLLTGGRRQGRNLKIRRTPPG